MKKLILVIALSSFMYSSCKKNSPLDVLPGGNCVNFLTKYSEAALAYSSTPSVANCNKVKSTLTDVVNKCTMFTGTERAEYEAELRDWKCDS